MSPKGASNVRIVVRGRRVSGRGAARRPARDFERAVAEFFMRLAIDEARKGLGKTSPNPAVGAVLVKNGRVVARGHHRRAGSAHAEVVALRAAGRRARGADLYVTLEPCNHHGRTPPCTDAIVAAGVKRVFVGCLDANPIVNGRGVRALRARGVPVVLGVLGSQCRELHQAFFTFIRKRRPFVTLKIAATLDGKIATEGGDSRWVSGGASRERVHALRGRVDAVLVGAGTVRADDPKLTARPGGRRSSRQPLRVVLSGSLRLSPSARVFTGPGRALVLTGALGGSRVRALASRGIEVVSLPSRRGKVALRPALALLARRSVVHLLVEGGGEMAGHFLEEGLFDEIVLFVAPKVLGEGRGWARFGPLARLSRAPRLRFAGVERVGEDLVVTALPG